MARLDVAINAVPAFSVRFLVFTLRVSPLLPPRRSASPAPAPILLLLLLLV